MTAHEIVLTVLRDAFPNRTIVEVSGVGPSWNGANETVRVAFANGNRAFCKVAVDDNGTRIARERAVLRYVRAARQIPVPDVLSADPSGSPPYLVTAPVLGRELRDVWNDADEKIMETKNTDSDTGNSVVSGNGSSIDTRVPREDSDPAREALLQRVGRMLATLHAERFDSHGEITGLADVDQSAGDNTTASNPDTARPALAIDPAPWPDVLLSTIDRTREIGTTERLADHYEAVIGCVEANYDRLTGAQAALLHGDVAMPNLFVVDNEIAAIDWELAHVGDPVRDLVRAEDQLLNGFDTTSPERYAAALCDGYRERAGGLPPGFTERRPIYEVVRMLGRSGFLDQWVTHLDTTIDALVDRADAELQSRLDAV